MGSTRTTRIRAALAAGGLAFCGLATRQADVDTSLLQRVARHVVDYEERLGFVIADEDYTQEVFEPVTASRGPRLQPAGRETLVSRRHLRSEFMLVRVPTDQQQWIGVRDVTEVDGRTVNDRSGRLDALLKLPFGTAADQFQALQEESARFNIGAVRRTLNVPTFGLMFLRPEQQRRFRFETVSDATRVVIRYSETGHPAFIRDDRGVDVPASGEFRFAPDGGSLLDLRLVAGLDPDRVRATITVKFSHQSNIDVVVPVEMRETYRTPAGQRIEGSAKYTRFRRFDVDASWKPVRVK